MAEANPIITPAGAEASSGHPFATGINIVSIAAWRHEKGRLRAATREHVEAARVGAAGLSGIRPSPEERILGLMLQTLPAITARHDLKTIAARSGVDEADVARVMFVLTGKDYAKDAHGDHGRSS